MNSDVSIDFIIEYEQRCVDSCDPAAIQALDDRVMEESTLALETLEEVTSTPSDVPSAFITAIQDAAAENPNLDSSTFAAVRVEAFVPPTSEDIQSALDDKDVRVSTRTVVMAPGASVTMGLGKLLLTTAMGMLVMLVAGIIV